MGGSSGGGGGSSNTDNAYSNQQTGQGSQVTQPGPNTRTDSRGNTVNFNTTPTTPSLGTPNYTKTLPNGVQVVDYSTNFGGQRNLSNQASPIGPPMGVSTQPNVSLPGTAFPGGVPSTSQAVMDAVRGMNVTPTVTTPTTQPSGPFSNVGNPSAIAGFQNQVQQAYDQAKETLSTPFAGGRIGVDLDALSKGIMGLQYNRTFNQGGEVKPMNKGIGTLYKK